jgi:hypothetical protein
MLKIGSDIWWVMEPYWMEWAKLADYKLSLLW